ncbi:transmembrane and coiled-coil domains-containing protein 7 [Chytridiales sp. JEL 0842]|nr:transmembrane and coiled-coil domains-containing protein 7 [Chytridiales sp. JEL 0842]
MAMEAARLLAEHLPQLPQPSQDQHVSADDKDRGDVPAFTNALNQVLNARITQVQDALSLSSYAAILDQMSFQHKYVLACFLALDCINREAANSISEKLVKIDDLRVITTIAEIIVAWGLKTDTKTDVPDTTQIERVSRLVSTAPSQTTSIQEYYTTIGSQLIQLLQDKSLSDPKQLVVAHILTQMVNKKPALAGRCIINKLFEPFIRLFEPDKYQRHVAEYDLHGRPIIVSDQATEEAFQTLRRLILKAEPSPTLSKSLQFTISPLYSLYELSHKSPVASMGGQAKDLLKALLRLCDSDTAQRSLFKLSFGSMTVPWVCVPGPTGGAMFVKKEDSGELELADPDFFVEFLEYVGQDDWTCGVFLKLLEYYAQESANPESDAGYALVNCMRALLSIINRFGAELIKSSQQILDLSKSIMLSNTTDTNSIVLALGLLKMVLSETEEKVDTNYDDILIILQTFLGHEEEGIRMLAKDIRSLMLTKKERKTDEQDLKAEKKYMNALKELADELLPVRAHGLNELRQLILEKSSVASKNLSAILTIFLDSLQDEDSFIYLHAVKGLSTLTDIHPSQSIRQLMNRYKDSAFPVESRLRVGEVVMQTIRRSSSAFVKIAPEVLPTLLMVLHDPEPQLRASATSLVSYVAELAPLQLLPVVEQVVDYLDSVLTIEKDADHRRGAVVAIASLLKGMSNLVSVLPQGVIRKIYHRLKIVADSDSDETTRGHARASLAEMKAIFFEH